MIPNAKVELENVDTGLKRAATAGPDGHYAFQQVTPGAYKITCRADGFQSTTVNEIRLLVNNPATVNVRMEVGSITDSVSVSRFKAPTPVRGNTYIARADYILDGQGETRLSCAKILCRSFRVSRPAASRSGTTRVLRVASPAFSGRS